MCEDIKKNIKGGKEPSKNPYIIEVKLRRSIILQVGHCKILEGGEGV